MEKLEIPDFRKLTDRVIEWGRLKHERGTKNVAPILHRLARDLEAAERRLRRLPVNRQLAAREPDGLAEIRALRPAGPRRLWADLPAARYRSRLAGAMLGRFAGCTLGAPVEFWEIRDMQVLARETGHSFPPRDYWPRVPDPHRLRYGVSRRDAYTREKMNGVPVDDDLVYTQLGLLVAEDFGLNFTVDDVGRAWVKYLPHACTAEAVALRNLREGMPACRAGEKDNPYCEWIGASIRADPWGYISPGWPEAAARMAYHDARLSHRRQGVYAAMLFAAAISAGFAVDDPVEAVRIGLTEIPRDCTLARAVRWALKTAPRITNYRPARKAVERHFPGRNRVHAINNACLTVWGLTIGGTDFTRVVSETVAMGMDNDCTAATAGSICGAVVGKAGIPPRWYRPFHNRVLSYLKGHRQFAIDDLLARFERQARRLFADGSV